MTEEGRRRIVVAMDASEHSVAGLEAAIRLAEATGAEVVGVFVEDERLLGAAQSPFASEVDYFSGDLRRLQPAELERQIQSDARRARATVRRLAEGRVPWQFRTLRGHPDAELQTLAREADVITVGIRGRSPGRGPGSTVRFLLTGPDVRVLVVRRGRPLQGAVHVLHDGSAEADEALDFALGLERTDRRGLVVLTLGSQEEGDRLADLESRLEERLQTAPMPVRILRLTQPFTKPDHLCRQLDGARAGLLVAARSSLKATCGDLRELLHRAPCPVLVTG